jgi:hypothetical protein
VVRTKKNLPNLNLVVFFRYFAENVTTGAECLIGNSVQTGSGPAAVILIPVDTGINAFAGSTPLLAEASGKAGKGQESQKTCL